VLSVEPQPITPAPEGMGAEALSEGVGIVVSRPDTTSTNALSAQASATTPLVHVGRKPRWRSGLMPIFAP
jgi:hypothetical protein